MPAAPSSSAASAAARPSARPQKASDLRRNQLLDVAAQIIETEGLATLRPARLAELAGCTRPLVYRYFPRREDILIGISERFYEALDERMASQDQGTTITDATRVDAEAGRQLHEAVWDVIAIQGPAAAILRCASEVGPEFREYLHTIRDQYERRWSEQLVQLGIQDWAIDALMDVFVSTTRTLALKWRDGEISRDRAIEFQVRALAAVVRSASEMD